MGRSGTDRPDHDLRDFRRLSLTSCIENRLRIGLTVYPLYRKYSDSAASGVAGATNEAFYRPERYRTDLPHR
ncbi:hypothetical protein SAMN05216466_102461 [Paraburkholderia phenazinium]|jgi:hypothetical protein|uniref:Uncharacterized protein n=1 Tax=Paraburkholderia phenazinium TaxID=60549 RepID=A0A1G7SBQ6_9BURK|nr:hypothetical protein SAMN05216466_102461 [Paraburkholderia phenazinium]